MAARGVPLSWRRKIKLRGAGGERVDFARTVLSHGVADLPPNAIERDGSQMETVLPAGGQAWVLRLRPTNRGDEATLQAPGTAPPKELRPELLDQVRHMLRLDDDLSPFYAAAADDPKLSWVVEQGAGRMVRSPTVFEDVVKTICTTNCTWSATERMVGAIVSELGVPAEGAAERRTFPTAAAVAEADPNFFRDVARAGYRGAYLKQLAADVAEGRLDLEALNDPALGDDDVAEQLLALPGVGPYATAHMMMLLGRYRRLILDSWTRPTYRRLSGRTRITDKGIERAFRRYREFAGLAFWLTLTQDWVSA